LINKHSSRVVLEERASAVEKVCSDVGVLPNVIGKCRL